MKKSAKIVSLLLAVLLCCCTAAGCGNKDKTNVPPDGNAVSEKITGKIPNLIPADQKYTQHVLARGGETEYKIVIPAQATDVMRFAQSELYDRFYEATGAKLATVTDAEAQNAGTGKYISLGKNTLVPSGIDVSESRLGVLGYAVVTDGDDVFIVGSSDNGTVNGVYDFLLHTVNYRYYAPEIWQINDCTAETLYLPELNVADRPDVDMPVIRLEGASDMLTQGRRLRGVSMDETFISIGGVSYHTSMSYLPPATFRDKNNTANYHPEWYSTAEGDKDPETGEYTYSTQDKLFADKDEQLCYTAHGDSESYALMVEAQFDKLKECILSNPYCQAEPTRLMYAWYTQMDNRSWCACDACKAQIEKYGSNSATYVQMANDVAQKLSDWIEEEGVGRRVTMVIFAYLSTEDAPQPIDDKVKLADNVALMYAPINATYQYAFESDRNKTYADTLENWIALMNENAGITWWIYNHTWFADYLCPFYTFGALQTNIEYILERNGKLCYSQNQYDQGTLPDWGNLKLFLDTQLQWHSNQSMDDLLADYFNVVYRAAAKPMKEYFDRYCAWMEYMLQSTGFDGYYTDACQYFRDATHFPFAEIQSWLSCTERAYQAAETYRISDPALYDSLCDRICLETLMPRHLLWECHKGNYEADVLDDMIAELNNDMRRLGVNASGEGGSRWY